MENVERDKAVFLTTHHEWGLLNLLQNCGSETNVLIAVELRPKYSRTGLLEEKGRWIQDFWNRVLRAMPEVAGHRMLWSELFFSYPGDDVEFVEAQICALLKDCKDEQFESRCVLSVFSGDIQEKVLEIERMFMSIGKDWYFGEADFFKYWLLNGERFQQPS